MITYGAQLFHIRLTDRELEHVLQMDAQRWTPDPYQHVGLANAEDYSGARWAGHTRYIFRFLSARLNGYPL